MRELVLDDLAGGDRTAGTKSDAIRQSIFAGDGQKVLGGFLSNSAVCVTFGHTTKMRPQEWAIWFFKAVTWGAGVELGRRLVAVALETYLQGRCQTSGQQVGD